MQHGAAVRLLNPFTEGGSSASASGGPIVDDAGAMAREDGVEDEFGGSETPEGCQEIANAHEGRVRCSHGHTR